MHGDWEGDESACLAAIKGWDVTGLGADKTAKGVQMKKVKV